MIYLKGFWENIKKFNIDSKWNVFVKEYKGFQSEMHTYEEYLKFKTEKTAPFSSYLYNSLGSLS